MKLGIAIAKLNSDNNAEHLLDKIHFIEKAIGRPFNFVEGINNPEIMLEVTKHYRCSTLGSLIYSDTINVFDQFNEACALASKLNISNLMFGAAKAREKFKEQNKLWFKELYSIAKAKDLHLMFEPIKNTEFDTLDKVTFLQKVEKEPRFHLCLLNTEANKDDLSKLDMSSVVSCHFNTYTLAKYWDYIKDLSEVTLEL